MAEKTYMKSGKLMMKPSNFIKTKGYKRFFVTKRGGDYLNDKDMVIKLADAEICISNQWDLDAVEKFVEHMKKIGIRIE